jgi:hypothetical protein
VPSGRFQASDAFLETSDGRADSRLVQLLDRLPVGFECLPVLLCGRLAAPGKGQGDGGEG